MNRQAKSAIKSLVLTLRRKLEDDIAIQLNRWLPFELNKAARMWYNK